MIRIRLSPRTPLLFCAGALLAMVSAACGDPGVALGIEPVRSVRFAPPTFLCGPLAVGDSIYADAEAYGKVGLGYAASQFPRRFRWSSSAPEVVSVSPEGLLRAQAPGTATITAETDGITGQAEVRVTQVTTTAGVSPTRPVGYVSDTITVSVTAYDSAGMPFRTPGWPWFWTGYLRAVHVNERTPTGAHILALRSGTSPVNWCYAGRYGVIAVTVKSR